MSDTRYLAAEQAFWESYSASPTERWLDLQKPATTRVRTQTLGDGPPVVFLHGGPGAGALFAPVVSLLTDFKCIAIDRPGCGLSPTIPYATSVPEHFSTLFVACLDALGIDRARLVTSSLGGTCALWLAQRYPDRVERICHLGCPAFLGESDLPALVKVMGTPGLGFVVARLPMNRFGVNMFMKSMGQRHLIKSEGLPEAFVNWWIALATNTDTMKNEREAIRQAGGTWRGFPKEMLFSDESIQTMQQPMYFFWGENEPFGTPSYAEKLVEGMQQAAIHVVPNAGHLPWFDDREDAAERVRAFMAD
jgi:pimeloyl-ACP methyl ester carboxylesterase